MCGIFSVGIKVTVNELTGLLMGERGHTFVSSVMGTHAVKGHDEFFRSHRICGDMGISHESMLWLKHSLLCHMLM